MTSSAPIVSAPRAVASRVFLRQFALSATAFALGACATSTIGVATSYPGRAAAPPPLVTPAQPTLASLGATLPEGESAIARGDYYGAASSYQRAAGVVPLAAGIAADYRMRAAEAANLGNSPALADAILDAIPASALDARQQARYRLLRAETALARNDPRRALNLLPVGDPGGEPAIAERQLQARARALVRSGDAVGAVQARVTRERYLSSGAAIRANRDALWAELQSATLDPAAKSRAAASSATVHGWVDLQELVHRGASAADYDAWRRSYPNHPGTERVAAGSAPMSRLPPPAVPPAPVAAPPAPAVAPVAPASAPAPVEAQPLAPAAPVPATIDATAPTPLTAPAANPTMPLVPGHSSSVALLLPGSGPLAPIGEALRAGYNAAAARAGTGESRSYDTIGAEIVGQYHGAVSDGAKMVVGPLLKDAAATLAATGALGTPVLALNYLDAMRAPTPGLWQFGLAPEDEARAAADDAVARGLHRAVALVPDSDWGLRVLNAFRARMNELGARVVDSAHYSGDPQNWSDPVRRLLRYVPIADKKKAAEARAKAEPGIDPQRRNDIDFVFVAGRAAQARVLWPLLRYYHADRLPAYATASIYEGDGDSDLVGLRFCDAPWLLDSSGAWAALRAEARAGRSMDNARFFALGADAQLLATRIAQGELHVGDSLSGATGVLKVDSSGAIHRSLSCAQMGSGSPNLLPPPELATPAPLP